MTRCLCFAPRNGCHAHACPFPLFGGSPVELRPLLGVVAAVSLAIVVVAIWRAGRG